MRTSGSEDSKSRKQSTQKTQTKHNLKIIFLVALTNLLTFYIVFTRLHSQITALQNQLTSAHSQAQLLLNQLTLLTAALNQSSNYDDLLTNISNEAKLAIGPHKLPLGLTPRMGSQIYSSVGSLCFKNKQDLNKYMSYDVGQDCPVDDVFAQTLMLKGCEPLPRRRCHPKSPPHYVEPTPLPDSMWTTPPDSSLLWDPYTCKSYSCLQERRNHPGSYDCKDCFFLQGREQKRWISDNGGLDFSIDNQWRS